MKILKIFGVVVAVHAAVFMFVFAIPGCRSTTRQAPSPNAADTAPAPSTVSYPGESIAGPVSPGPGDASPSVAGSELNPGVYGGSDFGAAGDDTGSPVIRFNPTRPGTPVAGALKSATVGGVTPATTYAVAKGDSLWKIAKKHRLTVNELAAANNLKTSATLRVGQKLIIPGKAPTSASEHGPGNGSADTMTYTVRPGENLGVIARRAGTTVSAIRALNQLSSDNLRAGQDILLPAGAGVAAMSAAPAEASSTSAAPARTATGGVKHVVKPGETLSQIARSYDVPLRDVAAINNIANPASLRAGQELVIPGASSTEPTPREVSPVDTYAPADSPVAPAPEAAPVTTAPEGDAPPVIKVDEQDPVAPAGN